jgi:hypothetical protein
VEISLDKTDNLRWIMTKISQFMMSKNENPISSKRGQLEAG